MDSLPYEIIRNIFSRVSALDAMRMKFVSKGWKTTIEEAPLLRPPCSHYSTPKPMDSQVIVFRRGTNLCFVDLADRDRGFAAQVISCVPSPFGTTQNWCFKIVDSCNGLLCLFDSATQRILILNLFTNQRMLLPEHDLLIDGKNHVAVFGFGFDSTRNLYKVMLKTYEHCMICDIGSKKWRTSIEPIRGAWKLGTRALHVNGRLHWLNMYNKLIHSFDWDTEKSGLIRTPAALKIGPYKYHFSLIVFDGHLRITRTHQYHNKLHLEIWVMEQYDVEESWEMKFNTKSLGLGIVFPFKEKTDTIEVSGQFENGLILLKCVTKTHETRAMFFYDPKCHEYEFVKCKARSTECIHIPDLNWIYP